MAQKGFEDAGNVVLKQDVPDAGGTHDDLAGFVKFDFIERILEGEIIADLVPIHRHGPPLFDPDYPNAASAAS